MIQRCEGVIEDVAAMGHPGGGRQDIPNCLKHQFFIFNLNLPSNQAINEIYGQQLAGRFNDAVKGFALLSEHLPNVSEKLWTWMRTKMLPSPSKFHYVYNLRELSCLPGWVEDSTCWHS